MKILAWLLGIVMALAVVVFGLQIIASETGEVVVLHTADGDGDARTRLWVVDFDGAQWLRAGPDSGWLQRLAAQPRVELERDGERHAYTASVDAAMAPEINVLMAAKYGWREDVIRRLVGGREESLAIRLEPAE
jgi:hypothetical protein